MFFLSKLIWRAGDVVPRRCERRLGGKGMGLFRLSKLALSVPPFHVIATTCFEATIKAHRLAIHRLLAQVNASDQSSIQSISSQIQDIILTVPIPHRVARRIRSALTTYSEGATFAVRSSAVGEDSQEHSFAGQMESYLHVEPDQVVGAVVKVWASAFAPRALLYRVHRGLPLNGISTAVVVQQMVPSECSGVAFSRDPQTQAKTCVITAGYGLGEGVVQDQVEVDTYQVDWDDTVQHQEIVTKTRRVVQDPKEGIRTEAVPSLFQSASVLDRQQVRQLAAVVQSLEAHLGQPQDMEWAYRDGQLFVLQTRPIVVLQRSRRHQWRVWDNSNIVESYPGLTLPLTFSFVRECYAVSFRRAVQGFLLRYREIDSESHIFAEMIGLLNGRVYYNLLNWYTMLSCLPGFRHYRKSWDKMIGISKATPFPERRLSVLNRGYALLMVLFRLLTVRGNARRFFGHFQPAYGRYQRLDFSRSDLGELMSTFRDMQRDFSRRWHLTLYNDFAAMKYYDWLTTLCGRWGLEHSANLHNDLLCGEDEVESVRPIRSLLVICTVIRQEPRFLKLFADSDDLVTWRTIQDQPRYSPLKAVLDRHVADFGDRGLEELKLEQPTFRDEPERLIGLLKSYIQRGTSSAQWDQAERDLRLRAEATVRQVLRNPFKRALFGFVLHNARRGVANRENMRFARSRLFGIARRLFRRMGDLFVEQGILSRQEDFYYLTMSEVFGYINGHSVTGDLQSLADLRRVEYQGFQKQAPPDRLQTDGVPYPVPVDAVLSPQNGNGQLTGTGCSSGEVHGAAWVVSDPRAADRKGDYILVARSTDPGWAFLMIRARGIVVERGSVLSHTAIIGRELGIPTVVGVSCATTRIKDGNTIWLNGSTGVVRCV